MGKKQKMWDQMYQMLQQQIQRQSQPSPYETQAANEYNALTDWLNKRDYRNLPTGVNIPLLDVADKARMRKMMLGGQSDTVARGADPSGFAAKQRLLSDDMAAKDWAGEYENAVGQIAQNKYNLGNALQNIYQNRMNNTTQGYMGALQSIAGRPQGFNWGGFLSGMIGAGGQIASALI